jgi:hypothetical protein
MSGETPNEKPERRERCLDRLVLLREHHREQARFRNKSADETRSDLDRMIADGSGPRLFPGRWPETIAFNERQLAFDREQAAEHASFADAAETARLLLQNTNAQERAASAPKSTDEKSK